MQKGLPGHWLERNEHASLLKSNRLLHLPSLGQVTTRHLSSSFPSDAKWAQHPRIVRGGDEIRGPMMACSCSVNLILLLSLRIKNPT